MNPSPELPDLEEDLLQIESAIDLPEHQAAFDRVAALARRAQPEGKVEEIVAVLMHLDANGMIAWRGTGDDEDDALDEAEAKARTAREVAKAVEALRAKPKGEVWSMLNELYLMNPTPEARALVRQVDRKYEMLASTVKPEGEAPQAEPVAWRFREYDDREKCYSRTWCITMDRAAMEMYKRYDAIIEPLYTAPAAQHAESGAQAMRECPECDGTGRISPVDLCARCDHSGVLPALAAQSQGAQAQAIAYAVYGINGRGQHFIRDVKRIPNSDKHESWKNDDDGLGNYWAGNEALVSAALAAKAEAPAPDATARATDLVDRVIAELCGRKGVMEDIDDDVMEEIGATLCAIVDKSGAFAAPAAQQAAAPGAEPILYARQMDIDGGRSVIAYPDCEGSWNVPLYAAPSAPGTPEAPPDLDYSIVKGDTVYHKTWRLTSLEVVDVNWALRAVAVRLGPTGGVVVWPASCLSKTPYEDRAAQLDGGQGGGADHG